MSVHAVPLQIHKRGIVGTIVTAVLKHTRVVHDIKTLYPYCTFLLLAFFVMTGVEISVMLCCQLYMFNTLHSTNQ